MIFQKKVSTNFFLLLSIIPLFSQEIAFVGNSITASGYNTVVDSLLIDYSTYNFGVPGITVATDGFNYKNTQEYQDVIDMKPQFIIMLLGGNDWQTFASHPASWANFWQAEYKLLMTNFMKNSTLFLGTIPYRINESESIQPINDMNNIIKLLAAQYDLKLIDFNLAMGFSQQYFKSDGIHPNNAGKYLLAYTAYSVLADYLGIPLSVDSNNADNSIYVNNFPNPFNPSTQINYNIPVDTDVRLTVYDILGYEVKTLYHNFQRAGNHSIVWNGTNNNDYSVKSGIYFYSIEAGIFHQTGKMVLLK